MLMKWCGTNCVFACLRIIKPNANLNAERKQRKGKTFGFIAITEVVEFFILSNAVRRGFGVGQLTSAVLNWGRSCRRKKIDSCDRHIFRT